MRSFIESSVDLLTAIGHTASRGLETVKYVCSAILPTTSRTTEPEVGDMIKFERMFYSHYGVYVGNGYVIHLTGDKWSSSSFFGVGKPAVKKELLKDVANGSPYKVDNNREHEYKADDPNVISDRAHRYIGFSAYHLAEFNCETFASMCRYGRGKSKQAVGVFGHIESAAASRYTELRRHQLPNNVELKSTKHVICEDDEDEVISEDDQDDVISEDDENVVICKR